MISRTNIACVIILLVCCSACKEERSAVITYDLHSRDFIEKVFGTATLESANSIRLNSPRIYSPDLKVIELAPEGAMVETGDTVCKLEANEVNSAYDRFFKELEQARADLIKQEANNALQLSLLDAQLKESRIKAELSALDSVQIKFSPPVKRRIQELELRKNRIQEQKIIKKLDALKRINEQSLRALKSQIIQKEQLVQRFQDQLDMMVLTAPGEGMLVYATSPLIMFMSSSGTGSYGGKTAVGMSVMEDMPLVELPDLDSMQLVLMLPEAEYKRVQEGQKVIVRPESLGDFQTGGTVKSKSPASQMMSYQAKVKTYKIIIDIDSLDDKMLPGLSAECEIIIQNVRDTIVVPGISIFGNDSSKMIYVQRDDMFEPVEIETGLTNGTEAIISKGLKGDETIALVKPPDKLILKRKHSGNE